jgi:serine phosphatase RsbU (regulator of sigma subunit)
VTATFTSDFRHEFEREQEQWLRKRFLWYSGVQVGFRVLAGLIAVIAATFTTELTTAAFSVGMIARDALLLAMFAWGFAYAYRNLLTREATLRLTFWLIVVNGAITLLSNPAIVTSQVDRQLKIVRQSAAAALEPGQTSSANPAANASPGAVPAPSDQPSPQVPPSPDAAPDDDGSGDDELGASELGDPVVAAGTGAAPVEVNNKIRVSTGSIDLSFDPKSLRAMTDAELDEFRDKNVARAIVLGNGLGVIFSSHLFACLLLPWRPRECYRPLIPLLVINALVCAYYWSLVPTGATLSIILSPLIGLPGAAICWWRQGRFKDKFTNKMLRGRYGEMKQELSAARTIHESLFPKALDSGPVRFDYRYEPMRQIGGDYLYVRTTAAPGRALPLTNIALIDVTGHGIGAALTVNRLHGEIDRQFGENPAAAPGEILTGLNKYLHHTLATHSVYATALVVQIDPNSSTLTWASAGHPPAFLRTIDGRIDRVESTTFVLGACHGDDFQHDQRLTRFAEGDTLIAYTDGAIEARNAAGKMLNVAGMERLIASLAPDADGGWSSAILRSVDQFRSGPPEDDTLVVEIWRPVTLHTPGRV